MEVMIANILNDKKCDIIGTGFLGAFNGNQFIVTCRHVIDKVIDGKVVAILNCCKNVFPSPKDFIELSEPSFHPDDTPTSSYDIAIYKVPASLQSTSQPINIERSTINKGLNIGSTACISGYPVDYLKQNRVEGSSLILVPKKIDGKFIRLPMENLTVSGFKREIRGSQALQITSGERMGTGASGSPVMDSSEHSLVGLYIAEINATYTSLEHTGNLYAACYIPAVYIAEAVKALEG